MRLTRFLSHIDPGASPGPLLPSRLSFGAPVAVLVGANGCGKSTILRTIAGALGLPLGGGGPEEGDLAPSSRTTLPAGCRHSWRERPAKRHFFSGDAVASFAALLDRRAADRAFTDWGYTGLEAYGDDPLSRRSHGQGAIAVLRRGLGADFLLLDEPETALAPAAQVAFAALLWEWAREGQRQAIIATHSPIFMRLPDAQVTELDDRGPRTIVPRESHIFGIHARAATMDDEGWRAFLESVLSDERV